MEGYFLVVWIRERKSSLESQANMKDNGKIALLVWLILLIVMVVGALGVRRAEKLLKDRVVMRSEIAAEEERAENLRELEEEFRRVGGSNVWQGWLPSSEEEVAEFAERLELEATALGLILSIQFDDFPDRVDVGGKYLNALKMQLKIRGGYRQLAEMIGKISRVGYLTRTDEILLTRGRTEAMTDMTVNGLLIMR